MKHQVVHRVLIFNCSWVFYVVIFVVFVFCLVQLRQSYRWTLIRTLMHTFFQRKFQRKLIHLTEVAFTFAYGEYCICSSKSEWLFMCRNYCNDCFALMEHKVSQMAAEPFSLVAGVDRSREKLGILVCEVPGNTTHYMVT